MSLILLLVLLFAVMWFVAIRPQRKRQAEQQQMLAAMAPGDRVLTVAGIYGTLRSVDGDDVTIEIAPGVEVRATRRAIATIFSEPEGDELGELERLQAEAEAEVQVTGDARRP